MQLDPGLPLRVLQYQLVGALREGERLPGGGLIAQFSKHLQRRWPVCLLKEDVEIHATSCGKIAMGLQGQRGPLECQRFESLRLQGIA
ncbi:hypothetical protein A9179_07605 [Pseudomonas alcaligenes]|uniref:Uncharacterized protein n=1 Tax=Aquipseudomonas alcaligenes TaxID=43263 RepID=A0ABR7RXS4_AQUAC|nr:hypothetical protein [Pseudomonas alcaligenes]